MQKKIVKWGKRSPASRLLHAKDDKKVIATWRLDLTKILQVFNVRPAHFCTTISNLPLLDRTCNKHTRNGF